MKNNTLHRLIIVALCLAGIACGDTGAVQLRDGSLESLARKASEGKEICIVTLGGSITQNGGGHSKMIPDWFQKRFPKAKVTAINAGLSSTCSHSGAFRLQEHVLDKKPDLLVVEFAVNDDQDAGHSYDDAVKGMEGIVRNAHTHNVPVFMILYVNDNLMKCQEAGKPGTSIKAHLAVADHYGVPTLDVPKALVASAAKGGLSWKKYGGCHPNGNGYRFVCDHVTAAMEKLLDRKPKRKLTDLPEYLNKASYANGIWVHPSKATLSENWAKGNPTRKLLPVGGIRGNYKEYPLVRADKPGETLTFQFSGTAVGAFAMVGPDAGMVEVRVDKGDPKEVDLFHRYSRGLNYPRTVIFADGLAPGSHVLELKVLEKKNPKSKGTACTILYLSVNNPETAPVASGEKTPKAKR